MFDVNIYLQQSYHGIKPADGKVCGILEYQTQKGAATCSFMLKEEKVTANRLALLGLVKALSFLKKSCELDISTDNNYLVSAWEQGLPKKWERAGWRKSDGKEVKNADLWKEIQNAPHLIKMRVSTKNQYANWQKKELESEK